MLLGSCVFRVYKNYIQPGFFGPLLRLVGLVVVIFVGSGEPRKKKKRGPLLSIESPVG